MGGAKPGRTEEEVGPLERSSWSRGPGRPEHDHMSWTAQSRCRHSNTTMFVDPKDKQVVLIPLSTDK